jgi:hypothetical protein
VRVCLLEEVRPVNVFSMSKETDFWLHLVVMMPVQHCRMTVLQIKVWIVSGLTFTVNELKTFMSLSIMKAHVMNDTLQAYWSTQKSTEILVAKAETMRARNGRLILLRRRLPRNV